MENIIQCEICHKECKGEHGLRIHHGKMHKEENLQVLETSYHQPTPSVPENKIVKCPICEKGFKNNRGLRVHHGKMHQGVDIALPRTSSHQALSDLVERLVVFIS